MLSLVLSLLLWSIDLNMYGNLRNTSSGSRRIRRLTNVILGRFRCDIYRFACAFREIQANVWKNFIRGHSSQRQRRERSTLLLQTEPENEQPR